MDAYRKVLNTLGARSSVPQSEPLDDRMVPNNAGGFGYQIDDLGRLQRFLILGSSGGTYYIGERKLTIENLQVVDRLLAAGKGHEIVDKIVEISKAGRAVSNDPALFALARVATYKDLEDTQKHKEIRQYALAALPEVARIGTHLFHFVAYVKSMGKHGGPALTKALAKWYNEKTVRDAAYQVIKYQSRDGFSHRDVFRLTHLKPGMDESRQILYHYIVNGWENIGSEPHPVEDIRLIWAFEKAKRTSDIDTLVSLIQEYGLTREMLPTESLNDIAIWRALLEKMPMEAMVRNLGNMTKVGLLNPLSKEIGTVVECLNDEDRIKRSRMHPIKILAALNTYSSGKGARGDGKWDPNQHIVDALNNAFYKSFGNVEPTNKRILISIDVSGSMSWGGSINGIPGMKLHTAAGAMALVTANVEKNYHIIGVDTSTHELHISPSQRLDDVVRQLNAIRGGGTDLSLPIEYALQKGLEIDAFITYTDSESYAGNSHASHELKMYRERTGIPARMINVQMTSTHVRLSNPDDEQALEVVGFDVNTPQVIAEFIKL
jgi:60 kDa SS-A/Ro ribonucleoprotein